MSNKEMLMRKGLSEEEAEDLITEAREEDEMTKKGGETKCQ